MSAFVLDKEVCSIQDAQSERVMYFFSIFTFSVAFTLIAAIFNDSINAFLTQNFANFSGGILDNTWIAVQEEVTTRLLPAIITFLFIGLLSYRSQRCYHVGKDAILLGAFGGLGMALAELLLKYTIFDGFTIFMFPVMLMHIFNGALVMGVFFKSISDGIRTRDIIAIIGSVVVAVAIHFVWNIWLTDQQWYIEFMRSLF